MRTIPKSLRLRSLQLVICGATLFSPLTSRACSGLDLSKNPPDPLEALDQFSDLFENHCYEDAIHLGRWIRSTYRDKTYSVSGEILSVFINDSALTEYVLESYERSFLSFLLAASYANLGHLDDAAVELRRSYREGLSLIYNEGEDPVNLALMAALWENLGEFDSARPLWKRLAEKTGSRFESGLGHSEQDEAQSTSSVPNAEIQALRRFAESRLQESDYEKRSPAKWRITGLGRMPRLDWQMSLSKGQGGYYRITAENEAPPTCQTDSSLRLSTDSWIQKIGARYATSYHPLLNFKSWVRLPIGLGYGIATATLGAGLAAGGCAVDSGARADGALCRIALRHGIRLMGTSANVVNFVIGPDLRHWQRVPAAILLSRTDAALKNPCLDQIPDPMRAYQIDFIR